jgi:endoglucanase
VILIIIIFLCTCTQEIPIPGNELMCIFDADQVARKVFFLRTLPLFDAGDDVGMVLSPQCFHNLNMHTDIFNHSNLQFWEYMQPGYDAWGFISCTGAHVIASQSPPGWS